MMPGTMTDTSPQSPSSPSASTLPRVLDALDLTAVPAPAGGTAAFVGEQFPAPFHHILGGHIAAQGLIAAGRTVSGRTPHSLHGYFLRAGDARHPVDFEVLDLQEGRNFSARRITASQSGQVLMSGVASFCTEAVAERGADGGAGYQPSMPAAPDPDGLPAQPHPVDLADAGPGRWTSLRWFRRSAVDAGRPEDADGPGRLRIWWRPDGAVPDDPLLGAALVSYLCAASLVEPAVAARVARGSRQLNTAQRDFAIWFQDAPRLDDWLLLDQCSDSAIGARALSRGRMYNRTGDLVCTANQELYFPPRLPQGH